MLCCTRQHWFFASLLFAFAGLFRSNGIFLAIFIIWGLLVRPLLNRQKVHYPSVHTYFKLITWHQPHLSKSIALTAIVLSPFVGQQYLAYLTFCFPSINQPEPQWCSQTLPSIYSYVQSKYWNVGFLRYWTISQLPNFLLAAPSLSLIFAYSIPHLQKMLPEFVFRKTSTPSRSFKSLTIDPHVIHATILCLILLLASHTQIILRLAGSMPLTYWAAAWLLSKHQTLGRLWVTWSVLWSLISIVLWSTFLPPAWGKQRKATRNSNDEVHKISKQCSISARGKWLMKRLPKEIQEANNMVLMLESIFSSIICSMGPVPNWC